MLEELALNAWPARREILHDGWSLRFADGYTRRANSVTPLHSGALDVATKIEFCRRMYARQGLPVRFKLTEVDAPLAESLAAMGFVKESGAIVQTTDLHGVQPVDGRAATVELDDWVAALADIGEDNPGDLPRLRSVLDAVAVPLDLSLLRVDGRPVAAAMGARQDEWLGLFHVVVTPDARRRGFGAAVVMDVMNRAKTLGSTHAYLQVAPSNAPARRLYCKLGFRDAYEYVYWLDRLIR